MKLSEFIPSVAVKSQQINHLDAVIAKQERFFKSLNNYHRTGGEPVGIEQLYFDWLRTAYAYRRMMLQDLYLLAFDIAEVRTAITYLKKEVFRRGFDVWKPKFVIKCRKCGEEYQEEVKKCKKCGSHKFKEPDASQYEIFEKFRDSCNIFGQSLEEVLSTTLDDCNISDDAWVYLNKSYIFDENNDVCAAKLVEIRRIHPALMEIDLSKDGLPKVSHFICLQHREEVNTEHTICLECGKELLPVMYVYNHRGKKMYLLEDEIIHWAKFSPSESYGYSPLLTIMQKILTLSGMDRFLYRYFFERKTPSGIVVTYTDDPASLQAERDRVEAKMMEDPTYVPWIAASQKTGRGRTDFVRFFHTLQEMDYLPVREEIIKRVGMMYQVPPLYAGEMEGVGGISGQSQQLTMFGKTVKSDQRMYNEKVFPRILKAMGITDWTMQLAEPAEKQENQLLEIAQRKAGVAQMMLQMGFDVKLKQGAKDNETMEFEYSGEAKQPEQGGGGMFGGEGGIPGQEGQGGGGASGGVVGFGTGGEEPQEASDEAPDKSGSDADGSEYDTSY